MISPSNLPSPAGYSFGSHGTPSSTSLDDPYQDQERPALDLADTLPAEQGSTPALHTASSTPSTSTRTTANVAFPPSSPSTSFQKSAPASLSVALCRSLVLKYIYLTYLFLLRILFFPSTTYKKWSFGRALRHSRKAAKTAAKGDRDRQEDSEIEQVGAVGEKFLQQYTLDNHLGHSTGHSSRPATLSLNHNNSSSSNNGNSMLRRSSRFKSKSDLEEFAQTSTATQAAAAAAATGNQSLTRSSTSSFAPGYGTDSMAEDYSGDNSTRGSGARLRQRMGRPMSGLRGPGSHGMGGGPGGRKKTLVLDLDETLIHSTSRGSRSQGYMVEVLVDRHACLYYVYKRPHVDYFLKKVSEWYKLVIFTASMAEYADPVIDWLDQSRTLFDKRYFRQACYFRNGSYLKDLTVIDPDLSSVCLLDNSPISYSLNKENGIPIDSWFNDPNDEALLDLLPFLDALRFTEDVRSVLSLRTV